MWKKSERRFLFLYLAIYSSVNGVQLVKFSDCSVWSKTAVFYHLCHQFCFLPLIHSKIPCYNKIDSFFIFKPRYLFVYLYICFSLIYFTYLFIYSFIYIFIHSFIYLFIYHFLEESSQEKVVKLFPSASIRRIFCALLIGLSLC